MPLTGDQVLQQYEIFEQVIFGKISNKRNQCDEETRCPNWRKKSILFSFHTGKISLRGIIST
jgi:hypothetical protein